VLFGNRQRLRPLRWALATGVALAVTGLSWRPSPYLQTPMRNMPRLPSARLMRLRFRATLDVLVVR